DAHLQHRSIGMARSGLRVVGTGRRSLAPALRTGDPRLPHSPFRTLRRRAARPIGNTAITALTIGRTAAAGRTKRIDRGVQPSARTGTLTPESKTSPRSMPPGP